MKKSAGLVIIYDNKDDDDFRILLAHPTNAPWVGSYSIPKGHIEESESSLEAAIRETKEEVGLKIYKSWIKRKGTPYSIPYFDKKGNVTKKVFYYYVIIHNLKTLRMDNFKVQRSRLQIEEVNWAGFITYDEALHRINTKMKPLLRQVRRFYKKNWKF